MVNYRKKKKKKKNGEKTNVRGYFDSWDSNNFEIEPRSNLTDATKGSKRNLYVTIGQGSERRITQGKTHESILEQSKKYVIREKISCGTSD